MVQCFELSWFKIRFYCCARPVISYSSVPVTQILSQTAPYIHRASAPFYHITCSAWETRALSTTQWLANLSRMFVMWVWACGRPERQVFSHACKSAVTTTVFSRHEEFYRGMKEALNCAEWKTRAHKTAVSSIYKREADLKTNFPLCFHMLSIYLTPAKSWFLYH